MMHAKSLWRPFLLHPKWTGQDYDKVRQLSIHIFFNSQGDTCKITIKPCKLICWIFFSCLLCIIISARKPCKAKSTGFFYCFKQLFSACAIFSLSSFSTEDSFSIHLVLKILTENILLTSSRNGTDLRPWFTLIKFSGGFSVLQYISEK